MIDCIFTLDYEIYGDGSGDLKELVFDPAERLREIFLKRNMRFVAFVEVAELEKIEAYHADPAIGQVNCQVQQMFDDGFEIALHLHPQWYGAEFSRGLWRLNSSEYNLCVLSRSRIAEIVDMSIRHLERLVNQVRYVPLSFRAGNWLFQPTSVAAGVLGEKGVWIDSSVFKGGLQHNHRLDYRSALNNGYFWTFNDDVSTPDSAGSWVEIPIYSEMVPVWKMPTTKRLGFGNSYGLANRTAKQRLNRVLDFARPRYPLKLDFCRMTFSEFTSMFEQIIRNDRETPESYKPIVAIGHTKDIVDLESIDRMLEYLTSKEISIRTFTQIASKLRGAVAHAPQFRAQST